MSSVVTPCMMRDSVAGGTAYVWEAVDQLLPRVPVAAGSVVGEPEGALAAEVLGPEVGPRGVERLQPVEES